MKIGITSEIREKYNVFEMNPNDYYDEFVSEYTIKYIMRVFKQYGNTVEFIGDKWALIQSLTASNRYDIIFNLAEGIGSRNRESEIPMLLEIFGIPYIGSDPLTLGMTLDKQVAHDILIANGIPCPKCFSYENQNGLIRFIDEIDRKVIVKCLHEGSSIGITKKSVSSDFNQVIMLIQQIEQLYNQNAFIEEYIDGDEYTVLVMGNENSLQVYPPLRVLFQNPNLTFNYDPNRVNILVDEDPRLYNILRPICIAVFKSFGIKDICRIDFRVKGEKAYVIDINCIPSYDLGTHFTVLGKHTGESHRGLLKKLLDIAYDRYKKVI